jgi:antirestriction protein ArdC
MDKVNKRSKKMASQKIYDMVTEKVVNVIEDAIREANENENARIIAPWQKPWIEAGMPINLVSKKAYRGINIFLLSMLGYASPYFVSYNQAKKLGGKVKEGEKGFPVIFWKWLKIEKDEDGNKLDKPKKIPMLRYYTVFNVDQCEGFEDKIPSVQKRTFNPIEDAQKIISNMPNAPKIEHGEARAYYVPALDYVNMPKHELFKTDQAYYSTAFHELVHSTGHASRLSRKEVTDFSFFGSHDYSIEELVAEMGSVFLCNECGIESTFDNSLAYLKTWLRKLKDDTKMLITAGARAQKAVDYILDKQFEKKND